MDKIRFKKLVSNAVEPIRAHDNDAGFDMVATSKKETNSYIQYGTGIALEIPDGMVGLIYPRSSITKKDLMLKNSVGIIDAGYRGEISFRFYKIIANEKLISRQEYNTQNGYLDTLQGKVLNYIFEKDQKTYEIGDKIGQIIFQILPQVTLLEVEELDDSERNTGGFGSTDKPEGTNVRTVPESHSPDKPTPPATQMINDGENPNK